MIFFAAAAAFAFGTSKPWAIIPQRVLLPKKKISNDCNIHNVLFFRSIFFFSLQNACTYILSDTQLIFVLIFFFYYFCLYFHYFFFGFLFPQKKKEAKSKLCKHFIRWKRVNDLQFVCMTILCVHRSDTECIIYTENLVHKHYSAIYAVDECMN